MLLERADRKLRLTDTIAPAPFTPSTAGERLGASYDAAVAVWNANSAWAMKEEAFDASSDGIFAVTGVRLPNPFRDRGGMVDPLPGPFLKSMRADLDVSGYETEVERLAQTYPDKAAAIRQHGKVMEKAYARTRASASRENDVLRRSPAAVNVPMLGPVDPLMLAGSIAGSFKDPVTAAVNLAGGVANGGKLLWSAAKAALINSGSELALQPFIKSWADEAGVEYSWSDAGRQVLAAGVLGGTLDLGVRGGYRAVQRGRGLTPETAPDGTITGWKSSEQLLDEAAKRLPPDHPVRRAAEGDPQAAAEVARAVNATEDPVVRGAIDDIEIDAATPLTVPGVDDGTNLLNLAQALRHADDPAANPPPVRAEPVPEATAPKLADDAPEPGRAFQIDGRAVTYAEVDLKQTAVDPATFQFKGGGDSAGATERLQGVERWDPIAAGRAVIYERTDGTRVIADAHQRRALAMRLADQDTSVPAFIFREADGWRPEDVRALAAKKNLQEGSGSVMDAATVLRERPDILDSSVPLRSEAMRQARSLAKLSDDAFASVKAGVVAPNVGALIGDLVPDKARHGGILDEVAGLDPANAREARLMISDLMQTPVHLEEQMTLLGVMRVERSLMKERVKVLDGALQALRQDARIFGLLDREAGRIEEAGNTLAETNAARAQEAAALAETIERLAGQAGPVADWLNASARAVAAGEKPGIVAKAFAKRVADTIERDGFSALFRDPTPLRAGGFDEPGGPDAQAQVKRLEMELRDAIEIAKKPEIADQRQAVLLKLGRDEITPDSAIRRTPRALEEWAAITGALKEVQRMLPPDVRLRVAERQFLDDLDSEVYGYWDPREKIIAVALGIGDPVRTARHETIHALRQTGLLTDAEFDTMYRFAERFGLREAYEIDKLYAGPYKKAYGHHGDAYIESLLREETVANLFSDAAVNGRRFGDLEGGRGIDKIIDLIRDFLVRLRNALGGLGFRDVRDVFEAIESGAVAARGGVREMRDSLADVERTADLGELVEFCKF